MKIRTKIILIFLGFTLLVSCDKWMDLIPPEGLIREEFWQTKEDVQAVLMGAYETFSKLDDRLFIYGEIRADMVVGDNSQLGRERQIQESNIYPTNALCNWQDFYVIINYCNEIIKNAPNVQEIDNTFSDFILESYLSEAYFLRSLSYFYLVRVFRDVPYITEPTESDDSELYMEKTDGEEILRSIIEDLVIYRNSATIDGYVTLEELKGRATKAAYDALLADIHLWLFDYEDVIKYVENIEANPDFMLLPGARWFDLFYPGNSLESIFELQFDSQRNQNNSLYSLTYYNGKKYDPSQSVMKMFSKTTSSEGIRGGRYIHKKTGEDNYIIWKYVGKSPDGETARSSSEQKSANFIIYRLADVKLMKAEALAQLDRFSEAFDVLVEIKERADIPMTPINESRNAYEDEILLERARELAFEGKRWFDLMRMGRRNDYERKQELINIIVKNVPSTQRSVLQFRLTNPLGWYLPIYEPELERNKNLIQNTYYNY